ncbi:MAG: DNA polymerase III subunit delta' [Campylobacterota bacterium]
MIKKVENSSILIVNSIDETLSELLALYPMHSTRIIRNEQKDEFLLNEANLAVKEAYIASNETKYIFLCGSSFRVEAQNSLLKVIEEPPRNVIFIIITTSKSSLLPTIYSRIPYKYLKKSTIKDISTLDVKNLDLKDIYYFLKQNQKISKNEAKELVESILLKVKEQKLQLNSSQLELFSKSIKLLELNSRPVNVLTTLLLSLLQTKGK